MTGNIERHSKTTRGSGSKLYLAAAIEKTDIAVDRCGAAARYNSDPNIRPGYYFDSNTVQHGFARAANGTFTTFDPSQSLDTAAGSINDKGVIAGYFCTINKYCPTGPYHGFARANSGTIKTFDPPGSTRTYPGCINDKGAIAGFYADGNQVFHGFLRSRLTLAGGASRGVRRTGRFVLRTPSRSEKLPPITRHGRDNSPAMTSSWAHRDHIG
jgi:hypothetical protein